MTAKWNTKYFFSVFCGYLCSVGILSFVVNIFRFSHSLNEFHILVACAVMMLALMIITSHFYVTVTFLGGLTISLLFAYLFRTKELESLFSGAEKFIRWLVPFYLDKAFTNPRYESILFCAIVGITCLIIFLFSSVFRSTLGMALVSLAPAVALHLFMAEPLPYILMIPAVFGVIIHMSLTAKSVKRSASEPATSSRGYWQTVLGMIPAISAGLLLMVILTNFFPVSSYRSQVLSDSANDMLSMLNLPLPGSSVQSGFNLASLGYYPEVTRLGGSIHPSGKNLMVVTTSHNVLLRASIFETYATTSWSSYSALFTCRLDSPFAKAQTIDVFDMKRPDSTKIPASLINAVLAPATITVTYLNDDLGTAIFSADHLLNVTKASAPVYYNEDQEVFSLKNPKNDQSYTITYNRFRTERSGFVNGLLALESYIIENPSSGDSKAKLKKISDEYLPVNVPDTVVSYAKSITADASTPLEKVLEIKKNLKENFTYSLIVADPPATDFVEHFLQTREGYCTYFATAMTVMARVNGIPARYVEGFAVQLPPGTDSAAKVTVAERNGHAWCEVYINGIGWIPIDATPGYSSGEGSTTGTDPNLPVTGFDFTRNTITPTPGGNPYDTSNHTANGTQANGFSSFMHWITVDHDRILLVLGVACALLLSVLLFLTLRRWEKTFILIPLVLWAVDVPPAEILTSLWNRCLRHLSLMAIQIDPDETVSDFSNRMKSFPVSVSGCGRDTYHFQLSKNAVLYERWTFGQISPTEEELSHAYEECAALVAQVKAAHTSKLSYLLHFLLWAK